MGKKKKVEAKPIPEIIEQVKDPARIVKFIKPFEGSLNGFVIKVRDSIDMELPEHVYQWIQKFKVCKDA